MDRAYRQISSFKRRIGVVEPPVFEDVDFGGFENGDPAQSGIYLIDFLEVLKKPFSVRPFVIFERLRMIGNGDVLVAALKAA